MKSTDDSGATAASAAADGSAGQAAEFEDFFAKTCSGMLRKARMLGHQQDAEDAVQEAYVEAFRVWHRIGGYESPEAWVYKIMRQRLWKAASHKSRQTPSGLDLEVAGPAPDLTDHVHEVIDALDALPGKMRFVMVMHCLNGMPQKQVARELGLADGTVRFYVHTARRLLEKILGLTPAKRRADQDLVSVPSADALSLRRPGPAFAPDDPIVLSLRAAEDWLRAEFEDQDAAQRRIRAAVATVASSPAQPESRWARWVRRLRRTRSAPQATASGPGPRGKESR
ncbi:RNA polymerase sigma factor (sigma-70 family) [Kitasatospora sp. MAP12-15]|uniref:RNA polymerase sigma factor n=1 Tax=unclassified Kitasatospora TaxID=2633591 RepID=UPI0024735CB0|nr:sigma-70 family RNA polymerase sigma factor [Kitasatospora sp. MAP12-44]MDH6107828.1 RNA polymerase sigma factor (sigma-70 family) [Kitasatospora sp. MAP12-44]